MSKALLTIHNADSTQILPREITDDPTAAALLAASDAEIRQFARDAGNVLLYARIDELPDALLNELAWALHVDYYAPELPISTKRALVRRSIEFHRRAGTRAAVEELIHLIWDNHARVVEWFELTPNLTPGVFHVVIDLPLTEANIREFAASIRAVKRAGDHYQLTAAGESTALAPPVISVAAGYLQLINYGTFEV